MRMEMLQDIKSGEYDLENYDEIINRVISLMKT